MSAAKPFGPGDLAALKSRGIAPAEALRQLRLLNGPPRPPKLVRPCAVGDGIRRLAPEERPRLARLYEEACLKGRALKFVPASGAASRMFKDLLAARDGDKSPAVREFLERIRDFPFFAALKEALARNGLDAEALAREGRVELLAAYAAGEKGLDLARSPKALLPFHRHPLGTRSALEEHLLVAAGHDQGGDGLCRLHFTVSPEHRARFEAEASAAARRVGEASGARFALGFSVQLPATDTLAVDEKGRPFRLADGSLLFRPGGHGALIENLNALGADIVFIKNVDNIVPDSRREEILLWKKSLGGALVELEGRLRHYHAALKSDPAGSFEAAAAFCQKELSLELPAGRSRAERARRLRERLDRPLRVCGVVENRGEPGGGPFWVRRGGEISLQIVEGAELDTRSPAQKEVFAASTHFNPVDLVCALRGPDGRPYDLRRFIEPAAVFITAKSSGGRALKALELPGLWNGAMARWNTVFVEVPAETFAPVKTVNDLLRAAHQP